MQVYTSTIQTILNGKLNEMESYFNADVIFYFGQIHPAYEKFFRDFIEKLKSDPVSNDRLVVVLNTPGGSAETVEKMVAVTRHHYQEVYFVVPDYAMSAGTIFCMSGDKIFMDYSSSLGPIDPQVFNGKVFVPALGYLDKVNEMIEKSLAGTLSNAEFLQLQQLDLAELRSFEQARDLTVSLLKEWLVKYKFKDWENHRSSGENYGKAVTHSEKIQRAEEIAIALGNNQKWHSHGRFIGMDTLRNDLRLEIEDFGIDPELHGLIRGYNDLICEFLAKNEMQFFVHSRNFF